MKGHGYSTYSSKGKSVKGATVHRGTPGMMTPKAIRGTYSSKKSTPGAKLNRGQ